MDSATSDIFSQLLEIRTRLSRLVESGAVMTEKLLGPRPKDSAHNQASSPSPSLKSLVTEIGSLISVLSEMNTEHHDTLGHPAGLANAPPQASRSYA